MAQSISAQGQSNRPTAANATGKVSPKCIRLTSPRSLASLCLAAFPDLQKEKDDVKSLCQKKIAFLEYSEGVQHGKLKDDQGKIIAFVKYKVSKHLILPPTDKGAEGIIERHRMKYLQHPQSFHSTEKKFLMQISTQFDFIARDISKQVLADYQIQEQASHDSSKQDSTFISNDLIILEHGDLNLCDILDHHHLSMQDILNYTDTLLTGIDRLTQHNLCHNDIKPEHILFLEKKIKLIDWSHMVQLHSNGYPQWIQKTGKVHIGTLEFCPPEILYFIITKAKKNIRFHKKDIWAVGLIMFSMLSKSKCLSTDSRKHIYETALYEYEKNSHNTEAVFSSIKNLMHQGIHDNLHHLKRHLISKYDQVEEEKTIILKYLKLILNILQVDLKQRIPARQALSYFKTEIQPLQHQLSSDFLNAHL